MTRLRLVSILALFSAITFHACAQQTAALSGTILDQSNAVVSGADVTLTNVESTAVRHTQTAATGRYTFAALPAGNYEVQAGKNGFQTTIRSGVGLIVGQQAAVDITLQLGPVSQKIMVSETAPIVSPAIDQSAGSIAGSVPRDLPLNGRSYDQLILLNPGVVNYSNEKNNNTPGISNSAVANMFAISGRRPQENLFLVDGVEFTGAAEINMTPGGPSGQLLGVDAIREFNVLTDTYSGSYGKRPGAQVLIVDRSGSNDFHGSAYEFLRNSFFDARNFFDRATVPKFERNQFGGSLGGALKPNKSFLFGNYEGYRQILNLSDVTLVPDNKARLGILPSGTVAVSPVAAKLLALWPVQNGPELGSGIAEAFSTPRQTVHEDFGTTRFDQVFSARDTAAASYTIDDGNDRTPTANPLALDVESLREQVATVHETHVFSPYLVNTATVGFSRAGYFYTGEPGVSGAPSFIGNDQVGAVVIGGSATPNTSSSITMGGSNNGSHLFMARNLFTYQDQVSITKGRHQISAGVWFQQIQSNDEIAIGQYGQATFSNLQTFLQGTVTTFTAVPSPTPLSWRSLEGAEFVEDQIRISPRLTLSLGFREEWTNGWNEAHGRAATFTFGPNGALETQPRVGSSVFTKNRASFLPEPRIALAWDPAGNGTTVLRAGFGMYNDLQDALSYRLDQNAPFNTSITLSKYPLANFPIVPLNIPATFKVAPAGVQQDLFTPTVISWTFGLEQKISRDSALSVTYAGSHGYHETMSADLNQPALSLSPIPAGTPLANPALASTWTWVSWANSSYNAMKVDYNKRLSGGLQFRTAYTWSKSLDDGDTLNASAAANAPGLASDSHNVRLDWGPSTFDVRQVLAVSGTYELPLGRNRLKPLLAGWTLNAIESYNTGLPFTPQLSFNPSNNGNTTNPVRPSLSPAFSGPIILGKPNEYFNRNAFVVPATGTYGNVGRDAFTGPGLANLDVALAKDTPLKENLKLELRGEVFNILNHANFNTPNLIVFTAATAPPSGSGGVITSTATSSRQIQVAAKLVW